MASAVATPLERQFGRIAGINQMTSTSQLGSTSIVLQFDLNRNIDAAGRDVQAAINAARSQLPANLPGNPTYRKVNPADAPILILALTSDIITLAADVRRRRLHPVAEAGANRRSGTGVRGRRRQAGGARRIESHAAEQAGRWPGHGAHRARLCQCQQPERRGRRRRSMPGRWMPTIRLFLADQYRRLIVSYNNGAPVRLGDVGTVAIQSRTSAISGCPGASLRS